MAWAVPVTVRNSPEDFEMNAAFSKIEMAREAQERRGSSRFYRGNGKGVNAAEPVGAGCWRQRIAQQEKSGHSGRWPAEDFLRSPYRAIIDM